MLGSTILGFHTRYHCKNFIETVDRYLEARIEHEHSTIAFQGKETWSRATRSRSNGPAAPRWRPGPRWPKCRQR
jgi:trehalose-6-phosphate synthase